MPLFELEIGTFAGSQMQIRDDHRHVIQIRQVLWIDLAEGERAWITDRLVRLLGKSGAHKRTKQNHGQANVMIGRLHCLLSLGRHGCTSDASSCEVKLHDTEVKGATFTGIGPSGNVCCFPKNVGFNLSSA